MIHSPAFALFYAIFFSFLLALFLIIINKLANTNSTKFTAKYRTYECGFLNFNQLSHKSIKIGYFFVGILFLLFDLEILFLVP
jgi:NADH:ubiquinone oxidoreductase subunit 3 (subunit A)